ncbi:MAG: hypothetical protein K0S53_953 [Bacteroidetes bacterium]|jgi:hypothetical protein|nr:hypothetical protein [Bacteroidota bacterium]
MTNYEKHEAIKNELIQYGKTYKKQGNAELSKSFLDTASLVRDLTDIYRRNNYSLTDVIILRTKINHNFNHLQRAMTSRYSANDINRLDPMTKQVLVAFSTYYNFFQFENKMGTA